MISRVMLLFFTAILVASCVDQPAAPIEYGGGTNTSNNMVNTAKSTNGLEQDEGIIVRRDIEDDIQEKTAGILKEEQESSEESDDIITVPAKDDNKVIYHEVQEDETLESIARDYDQNVKALASLNDLSYPYQLDESQIIKIKVSNELLNKKNRENACQVNSDFIKPVDGKIITNFGEETQHGKNKGINIAAKEGSIVKSITAGTVVYSGYDKQFGNLTIVKLDSSDLYAAYAHLKSTELKKGDVVAKGDVIGHVGHTGNAKAAQLHFAIRKGKIAVDPATYVPLN
ncbi:M23 family metallopeptidase [Rickettsia endosymbiont of Halotydeus destructor]|uniref:M23 family metallopeptidase n=1 Tax=Rickettsia endosymbiont of Halotydeus destructor TaxID=2996754 RepID=UPI003BAF91F7